MMLVNPSDGCLRVHLLDHTIHLAAPWSLCVTSCGYRFAEMVATDTDDDAVRELAPVATLSDRS
jgi:hypothetical protein